MKKLYVNLVQGIAITIIIFSIFFVCQNDFAQQYDSKQQIASDTNNTQPSSEQSYVLIKSLEAKVALMEKYVNNSQKNLDAWLKLLAFILSVLIGYSVFSGLRAREVAREELTEIRKRREEIIRVADDAEGRLKFVRDQLAQIENTAAHAKIIEEEMSKQLNEFASKEDIALSEAQKLILNDTIAKTQKELEKSGIETLKNLYYAKAIKAYDEDNYADAIRLMNNTLDFDEDNAIILSKRGFSFFSLYMKDKSQKVLLECALSDYNLSIKLDPQLTKLYFHRGIVFMELGDNLNALIDFNEFIRLNPNIASAYKRRSNLYKIMGETAKAEEDLKKVKELET